MLQDLSVLKSHSHARRLLPDEPLIAAEALALDSNDVDAAARLISEAHVLERDSVIDYVRVSAARRGDRLRQNASLTASISRTKSCTCPLESLHNTDD